MSEYECISYLDHKRDSKVQSSDWKSLINRYEPSTSPYSWSSHLLAGYKLVNIRILEESHDRLSDWIKEVAKQSQYERKQLSDELPDNVKSFVAKSNMPNDSVHQICLVIRRIREFLQSKRLDYQMEPDLFIDPEESESPEIELRIRIKKDLEYIYNNIRSPIYDIAITNLPKEILSKILLNLEPL